MFKRTRVAEVGFLLMPLVLAVVAFPLRKYFDDRPLDLDKKKSGPELAMVVDVEGPVLLRHKDQTQFEKVEVEASILNKDQLRVEAGGKAKVKFASGTEIELTENSDVVFELWRADSEDSPIYLHFFAGDYQVVNLDRSRPIYASMNDSLFLLQNKTKETARKLNIRTVPSALSQNKREQTSPTTEVDEAAKALPEQLTDGPPSNAFIDQTIATQKNLFQKCQTNSIRNKKQSKGHVVAGITISPSGHVSEAKLLNTDFKDLDLANCAIDVIRRIRFPSYKGDEIVRSYPLQFE